MKKIAVVALIAAYVVVHAVRRGMSSKHERTHAPGAPAAEDNTTAIEDLGPEGPVDNSRANAKKTVNNARKDLAN